MESLAVLSLSQVSVKQMTEKLLSSAPIKSILFVTLWILKWTIEKYFGIDTSSMVIEFDSLSRRLGPGLSLISQDRINRRDRIIKDNYFSFIVSMPPLLSYDAT